MYLVTGGSSGLGRALAVSLSKRGCNVLIVGRNSSALAETVALAPTIESCVADIALEEGRKNIIHTLKNKPLHGIIHCAGILEPLVLLSHVSHKDWQRIMATNVDAPLFLTQSLLQHLDGGRVLFISSGLADFAIRAAGPYCVSKAALHQLWRAFKEDCPEVSFGYATPGIMDTPMFNYLASGLSELAPDRISLYQNIIANKLCIQPEVVAEFLTWLILDADAGFFSENEWNVYDIEHHSHWLKAPHIVPQFEKR